MASNNMPILRAAMSGRWPITQQHRQTLVNDMATIAADSNQKAGTRVVAGRNLVMMDSLNLKEEELRLRERIALTPKIHVHSDMTVEQLQASIKDRLKDCGLSMNDLPEDKRDLLE